MGKRTERFRKDHDGLLKIAGELNDLLNPVNLKKDASLVGKVLGRLSGMLKVHLTAEDNQLYPMLLKSGNKRIKSTAEQFIQEMGGIKDFVGSYSNKWLNPENIQNDPNAFIGDTKFLLKALAERIDRENNVLYNLVDDEAA